MHIRCPHCHEAIEVVEDSSFTDVECPSCGSQFNLLGRDDTTETHRAKTRTLSHFELIEQLGVGHFGAVWKAKDTKLDRFVAIKIPRKEQLDETEAELFLRDARAAAQLKHSNIVTVHEVGKDDDTLYIAMDYIEGADLKEWLGGEPISPREAAELMIKICDAVHHAHESGVTHRDLKPANVMMSRDGQPHVMDFGLAKRESGEITMTVDGATLGTPAYMSPEQARGKAHEADGRSDVYSLGVMLFEMLSGETPFRGEKRMLIVQILEDDPPSLRRLNSFVSKDLETICLKCLRKEPERRYQSAKELADDLRRVQDNQPIKARPVGQLEKARLWCKRRPAVAGLLATVLLVIVVASVVVAVQRRANQGRNVVTAVNALQTASGNAIPFAIRDLKRSPKNLVLSELKRRFAESQGSRKLTVAYALADYGEVELEFLLASIAGAPGNECANIVSALDNDKENALREIAELANEADEKSDWKLKGRLAVLALHLGDASLGVDVNQDRPDPTQQTVLIHDVLSTWHGDLQRLADRVRTVDDELLRAGICLAMGNLPADELANVKTMWQELITKWYLESPDSGTHSAAVWALRQWKVDLPEIVSTPSDPPDRNWKVTPHGLTMVRIPAGEFERADGKTKQTVTLTGDLWLSDVEVTVGLFQQFMDDKTYQGRKPKGWAGVDEKISPTPQHPAQKVSWEDAVLFCNWLSDKDARQPCYKVEPIAGAKPTNRSTLEVELLPDGTGYRLPTEAEWEYACRAGTTTDFGFGSEQERLSRYAVVGSSKAEKSASKMCNRWGLFDIHGNVWELCQDWYGEFTGLKAENPTGPKTGSNRVFRGGSWNNFARSCRSGYRNWYFPSARLNGNGFRVAQVPLPVEKPASGAKSHSR